MCKLHVKLWLQAPEVMVHFICPFISSISLLAGFHSLNRMPLVSEMVHTRGLSFAVQRKIDQLPNMPVHLLIQNRVATVRLIFGFGKSGGVGQKIVRA